MPSFQPLQQKQVGGSQDKCMGYQQSKIKENARKPFQKKAAREENALQETNVKHKAAGIKPSGISKGKEEKQQGELAIRSKAV